MLNVLDISASALSAQRTNMDTIAGNIANAEVTRDEAGRPIPYRRRVPLFSSGRIENGKTLPGVRVEKIVEDPSPFHLVEDPSHPDAIVAGPLAGYVRKPNVELTTEMVNLMVAARAYEANVSVMETVKSLFTASLRLLA
ncbi:MAG: flagellar basal-body rod protein FlgC [Ignavibacteriota bacterium]|nr:MAG: flagellar basal-body rod protein FlgC [Ignavibacteriota bacterium]